MKVKIIHLMMIRESESEDKKDQNKDEETEASLRL